MSQEMTVREMLDLLRAEMTAEQNGRLLDMDLVDGVIAAIARNDALFDAVCCIRDGIKKVESEGADGIHEALDPEDDDDQTGVPQGYSVGQWRRLEEDHSFTPTGEWSASTDKTLSVGVPYSTREAAIRACEAHRDRVIAGAKP